MLKAREMLEYLMIRSMLEPNPKSRYFGNSETELLKARLARIEVRYMNDLQDTKRKDEALKRELFSLPTAGPNLSSAN